MCRSFRFRQMAALTVAMALSTIVLSETALASEGGGGALPEVTLGTGATQRGSCGGGLTWELNPVTGTLTIGGSAAAEDVHRPWVEKNLHPLVRRLEVEEGTHRLMAGMFADHENLTAVSLPATLGEVPEKLFSGCVRLTDIQIPEGVTQIGDFAFEYCTALTQVGLPQTLEGMGKGAFRHSGLTSIFIPQQVARMGAGVFEYCGSLRQVELPPKLGVIPYFAFEGCQRLTHIDIPDQVQSVNFRAFYGCAGLETVRLPARLRDLEFEAFAGCTGLTTLTFPPETKVIGQDSLRGCTSLRKVHLPATVTQVYAGAFVDCPALKDVHYAGTWQQWKTVRQNTGLGNEALLYEAELHCIGPMPTLYPVRIWDGEGSGRYERGEVVTITFHVDSFAPQYQGFDYILREWQVLKGEDVRLGNPSARTTVFAMPEEPVEIGAVYHTAAQPGYYFVDFETAGGSSIPSHAGAQGLTLIRPADPTRPGYRFGGWYRDRELRTPWNFEQDVITGSMTLFARWDGKEAPNTGRGGGW